MLLPLSGKPLLGHVVDRLRSLTVLDDLMIATSTDGSDDDLAGFSAGIGVRCFRGSLDDVLGRVHDAAKFSEATAVVRVTGDSPLLDPRVVETAISVFRGGGVELVTNTFPRSFPIGQSVEVIAGGSLERIARAATLREEREHVTRYVYNNPGLFAIRNFSYPEPCPDLRLAVDTPEDFARAELLLDATRDMPGFPTVDRLIALANARASRAG